VRNDLITSILARCLFDARFLQGVLDDPVRGLREYDLDDATLEEFRSSDLSRLADIRGFITKVKHNHLWKDFSYTRILLRRFGFELAAFRTYSASEYELRGRPPAEPRARIARFIDFLDRYLADSPCPRAAVIRAVLMHERLRWEITAEIKSALTSGRPQEGRALPWTDDAVVPVLCGVVRVAELDYDPIELVTLIPRGAVEVDRLEKRRRWLIYFASFRNPELQVLEAPAATALLLSLVDGRRTVREIQEAVGAGPRRLSAGETLGFFREVAGIGLVSPARRELRTSIDPDAASAPQGRR